MQINDIHRAVEYLGTALADEGNLVRIWAVASLASRVGVEAVLTSAEDRVVALEETGTLWADTFAELLEDEPQRRADALRAAHAVVVHLLGSIPGDQCEAVRARP